MIMIMIMIMIIIIIIIIVSGGASWEASLRRPQEDVKGMPIRHTEHCTYF